MAENRDASMVSLASETDLPHGLPNVNYADSQASLSGMTRKAKHLKYGDGKPMASPEPWASVLEYRIAKCQRLIQ